MLKTKTQKLLLVQSLRRWHRSLIILLVRRHDEGFALVTVGVQQWVQSSVDPLKCKYWLSLSKKKRSQSRASRNVFIFLLVGYAI